MMSCCLEDYDFFTSDSIKKLEEKIKFACKAQLGGKVIQNLEKQEIPQQYSKYEELFEEKLDKEALPQHKKWDHKIPLIKGSEPVYGHLYSTTLHESLALKEYLEKLEKKGFIRRSQSSYKSPMFGATKKRRGR